mgnify:CR=1 FL=1
MWIATELESAALAARQRLGNLIATAAKASIAPAGRTAAEQTLSRAVRTAVFEEALLSAIKARLAEVRTVAR